MTNLPDEEELLKQIMLTSRLVWTDQKIGMERLTPWLENFSGEVFETDYERKLALFLLSNFVYYNQEEVRHLCRVVYDRYIHELLAENTISQLGIADTYSQMASTTSFYFLGRPGESSSFLLYYFRQENNLPTVLFTERPETAHEAEHTLVLVDDVIIEGTQAQKYLDKFHVPPGKEGRYHVLALIASQRAIDLLTEKGYRVFYAVLLDDRNRCFSASSLVFSAFPDHLAACREMSLHYGKKAYSEHPLGYESGEYAFGFFYNIPDNSLPVFWGNENGWMPLLQRKQKIRKEVPKLGNGLFV